MISVENRTHGELDNQQRTEDQIARSLWTAIPGIVESVDYQEQTVTVQPTIREKVNLEGEYQWVELPKLIHVPFFIYSGGGYTITMPIKPGDECLVVFADMCIDGSLGVYKIRLTAVDMTSRMALLYVALNHSLTLYQATAVVLYRLRAVATPYLTSLLAR